MVSQVANPAMTSVLMVEPRREISKYRSRVAANPFDAGGEVRDFVDAIHPPLRQRPPGRTRTGMRIGRDAGGCKASQASVAACWAGRIHRNRLGMAGRRSRSVP